MSTQPSTGPSKPTPYGSAKDLPSHQEMAQMLRAGKVLTRFIARDQRPKLLEVEKEMDHLTTVVDDFYDRLGPRNWVFHDLLNVAKIEAILADTTDAESAEERLIELYRDGEATQWWLMRLRMQDGLRERKHQIDRAKEHYDADQFDSCVLQLIAVMDGFVNDFEPGVRKGIAARNPEDMTAWDSVVGHHMGLTNVMRTFGKTFKKRVDEEVFEVYRHGIVHGSVVRFDNVVVATKAWNLLYAVTDWAAAIRRAAEPQEPQPSWSDLWPKLRRQAAYREYRKGFVSATIMPTDPEFENEAVVPRASAFLEAWQHRRWGLVAAFTPPALVRGSDGEQARLAKNTFERFSLEIWELTSLTYDQASTAELRAIATINGQPTQIRFRMVLWTAGGDVAMPTDEGATWRLAVWAPETYFSGEAA